MALDFSKKVSGGYPPLEEPQDTAAEPLQPPRAQGRPYPTELIGLFALCLLGSSEWLIEGVWPSPLPLPAVQAAHYLFLGLVLGIATFRRRMRLPKPWRHRIRLSFAATLLIGLPEVLGIIAGRGISAVTSTALFALTPVAIAVLVSTLGATHQGSNRMLASALIGLAGVLLLLPFTAPGTLRSAGFAVLVFFAVLLTSFAAVWLHRLLADFSTLEAASICCLANAVFLLAVIALTGAPALIVQGGWTSAIAVIEIIKAICLDLPQVLLLLWLMRDVSPLRLSARYLLVPLLTVLEGFAMFRPEITFRLVAGTSLLLFGAWRLLTASMHEEEPTLVLH